MAKTRVKRITEIRGMLENRVADPRNGIKHNRPNKLARGMSDTANRSRHQVNEDALSLLVYGTTDKMRGLAWKTERIECPCCGHKAGGKLALNDAGRTRLRHMRRLREARKGGE